MTVKVKICGVTRVQDAEAAVQLGADMVGLNFHAPSPRCVTLQRAREIRDAIGGSAKLVGVFVNAARDFIEERVAVLKLDLIQLHGDEVCIDYGCMWGALTVPLALRTRFVLGVDQTLESLQFLKARLRQCII